MEKVASVGELKDKLCIRAKGKALALFKIKGKLYCVDNVCPHVGVLCVTAKLRVFLCCECSDND